MLCSKFIFIYCVWVFFSHAYGYDRYLKTYVKKRKRSERYILRLSIMDYGWNMFTLLYLSID